MSELALFIFCLPRSRVGRCIRFFLAVAHPINEIGVYDLQQVKNVREDDVRLECGLPPRRLPEITRESAVAPEVFNERIEGAP